MSRRDRGGYCSIFDDRGFNLVTRQLFGVIRSRSAGGFDLGFEHRIVLGERQRLDVDRRFEGGLGLSSTISASATEADGSTASAFGTGCRSASGEETIVSSGTPSGGFVSSTAPLPKVKILLMKPIAIQEFRINQAAAICFTCIVRCLPLWPVIVTGTSARAFRPAASTSVKFSVWASPLFSTRIVCSLPIMPSRCCA